MDCFTFIIIIVVISVIGGIAAGVAKSKEVDAMSPADRLNWAETTLYGELNEAMICPHCQANGTVRTKLVDRKKGISGSKATAAMFTGGVSLLATGLSRKERLTLARCGNCKNEWEF